MDKLVTAALAAQTWSLVNTAAGAAPPSSESAVQEVQAAQEGVRESAQEFLNAHVPEVIKRLGDAQSAATTFRAIQKFVAAAPDQSAALLGATAEDFEKFRKLADDFAAMYEEFCKQAEAAGAALTSATATAITRLSAGKGEIADTNRALKEMQQVVSDDLDDVIEASHTSGRAMRKILDSVAEALKSIGNRDQAAGGPGNVREPGEEAPPAKVVNALRKLRADSEKLAALHLQLAEQQAGVQQLAKVSSDCDAYVRSVRAVAGPARAVANMWQEVHAEYTATAAQHDRPGDGARLVRPIDEAAVKWEALQKQADRLRAAITDG
ncbi:MULTISPECIES: hypothetical protein [Streptomyces]|uniref:Uncharacterized protein n=1 Tax=Streptomyces ramulosus TaxID=47762 RepID=A0ABW1FEU1_9ACTN